VRPTLLSVGHLIRAQGHHLVIAALAELPGVDLMVVGDGPEAVALRAAAVRHGVADRVRSSAPLPHAELPRLYGAADALVLASSREGWANVLLEAMACGTPSSRRDLGHARGRHHARRRRARRRSQSRRAGSRPCAIC
jgi:glycosyltransferase involved in cell wall biosynthesis